VKLIGFDATEDHRTFASGGAGNICPDPELPRYGQRYEIRYPLREGGMDRAACIRTIADAGLPVPPKSACFFCPASKRDEIDRLAEDEPKLHLLALEMERRYRAGQHFRGDCVYSIKAVHKITGEKAELEVTATSDQEARAKFRHVYDDTARPYQYKVAVSKAVVGLGRTFAWSKRVALSVL